MNDTRDILLFLHSRRYAGVLNDIQRGLWLVQGSYAANRTDLAELVKQFPFSTLGVINPTGTEVTFFSAPIEYRGTEALKIPALYSYNKTGEWVIGVL